MTHNQINHRLYNRTNCAFRDRRSFLSWLLFYLWWIRFHCLPSQPRRLLPSESEIPLPCLSCSSFAVLCVCAVNNQHWPLMSPTVCQGHDTAGIKNADETWVCSLWTVSVTSIAFDLSRVAFREMAQRFIFCSHCVWRGRINITGWVYFKGNWNVVCTYQTSWIRWTNPESLSKCRNRKKPHWWLMLLTFKPFL